jgi:hypothetical protein
MSCKLKLWQHGVGQAGDGNEEFTESRGVTHNDHATSYSTEGDCSNTSWGVFFHNPPEQGSGIIIGKGDAAGGPFHENHHGEGKGSLNHRFYKINDEISFVKKIEFPAIPEGAILQDINVYGRRADGRQGQWGHYPFVDKLDLENPNHTQQQLTVDIKGEPCPGGFGIPIGHRTYRCMYKNNSEIQMMYSAIKDKPGDPRYDLYGKVVKKYCEDNEKISDSVGGGFTCEDFGADREVWCAVDKRIQNEPGCSAGSVGRDLYEKMAGTYCKENPGDKWCECYNLKNKVCLTDENAAGCKRAYGILEENKDALGPAILIKRTKEDIKAGKDVEANKKLLKKLQAQDGYPILKDKVHCRPNACASEYGGFIPHNAKSDCKSTYKICDQDINIKTQSNGDIIVACNTGIPYKEPSWWNDPLPPYERKRDFPYNLFPLNKTPMFKLPTKFRWKSKNVRYHVYSGTGFTISCIMCIIALFMVIRANKTKISNVLNSSPKTISKSLKYSF